MAKSNKKWCFFLLVGFVDVFSFHQFSAKAESAKIIEAVKGGQLDVGIGPISITSDILINHVF